MGTSETMKKKRKMLTSRTSTPTTVGQPTTVDSPRTAAGALRRAKRATSTKMAGAQTVGARTVEGEAGAGAVEVPPLRQQPPQAIPKRKGIGRPSGPNETLGRLLGAPAKVALLSLLYRQRRTFNG